MKRKRTAGVKQVRPREIYDVLDLRLALLYLREHGFDLEISAKDVTRLQVTCKRTKNRFVIEGVGHNDWPLRPHGFDHATPSG
jgi:hypothetical protein